LFFYYRLWTSARKSDNLKGMRDILKKHGALWSQKAFIAEVAIGLLFLGVALLGTYYANSYTTAHASNFVTDLLLDNLPVVNVDFIFNEGALIFIIILCGILLYEPNRIPFVLKSIALFTAIRSGFMMLTHLAPPSYQSYIDPADLLHRISSGNDLFFSAHTGLPFLLAFIFWDSKIFRCFFLFATVIGGVSVILGHLHYSIDVFSALFISFGIFHISKKLFGKDYQLFEESGPGSLS